MGTFGSEVDPYADRSPAGGFVELSNMSNTNKDLQQSTNSIRKLEPVVVTTVHSEESDNRENTAEDTLNNLTIDVFPKSTIASIQMGVTLLFILLLPAAFLTITSNPQYALIVCVFWFILVSLFLGLIWAIRAVVVKDARAQVFHPLIHTIAERIVQEIKDFHADFRQEFLLLTDGPADEEESRVPSLSPDETHRTPARKFRRNRLFGQPRKPKSAVFRAVVQPFLPFMRRRKAKQQTSSNEGEVSYEAPTSLV